MLGFEPLVQFDEGIKQFTIWVNKQEVIATSYEKSLDEMRSKGLLK